VDEAEYMAGTIRSGLNWFFSMAQTGGSLIGLKLQSGFGAKLPGTFLELKSSYDSVFHKVLESTHSIKSDRVTIVPRPNDVPFHDRLFSVVPLILRRKGSRLKLNQTLM
jgi:hypothetical protein